MHRPPGLAVTCQEESVAWRGGGPRHFSPTKRLLEFRRIFPLIRSAFARQHMCASTLDSQPETGTLPVQTLRVLLVDDSPQRAEILAHLAADERLLLSEPDHAVTPANWFDAADVVLCELSPGDELAVLDERRKAGSKTPVIIVTSRGNEYWAAEAIKRGAVDYISKQAGYLDRLSQVLVSAADLKGNGHVAANDHNGNGQIGNGHNGNGYARATDDIQVYTSILNALPVHLAMLDEHGLIRAVNDAWRKYSLGIVTTSKAEHVLRAPTTWPCATRPSKPGHGESPGHCRRPAARAGRSAARRLPVEYPCLSEGDSAVVQVGGQPLTRRQASRARSSRTSTSPTASRPSSNAIRLFEQSLSLLCIGGFDGYMRRWSRSVQVLGYTPNELMKLSLWSLLHPDDRELASAMGAATSRGRDGHRPPKCESARKTAPIAGFSGTPCLASSRICSLPPVRTSPIARKSNSNCARATSDFNSSPAPRAKRSGTGTCARIASGRTKPIWKSSARSTRRRNSGRVVAPPDSSRRPRTDPGDHSARRVSTASRNGCSSIACSVPTAAMPTCTTVAS